MGYWQCLSYQEYLTLERGSRTNGVAGMGNWKLPSHLLIYAAYIRNSCISDADLEESMNTETTNNGIAINKVQIEAQVDLLQRLYEADQLKNSITWPFPLNKDGGPK